MDWEVENAHVDGKVAFLLGSALRNKDTEKFIQIYDSLIPTGLSLQEVIKLKERAREISELPAHEFNNLVARAKDFSLVHQSTRMSSDKRTICYSEIPFIDDDMGSSTDDVLVSACTADVASWTPGGLLAQTKPPDDDSGISSSSKTTSGVLLDNADDDDDDDDDDSDFGRTSVIQYMPLHNEPGSPTTTTTTTYIADEHFDEAVEMDSDASSHDSPRGQSGCVDFVSATRFLEGGNSDERDAIELNNMTRYGSCCRSQSQTEHDIHKIFYRSSENPSDALSNYIDTSDDEDGKRNERKRHSVKSQCDVDSAVSFDLFSSSTYSRQLPASRSVKIEKSATSPDNKDENRQHINTWSYKSDKKFSKVARFIHGHLEDDADSSLSRSHTFTSNTDENGNPIEEEVKREKRNKNSEFGLHPLRQFNAFGEGIISGQAYNSSDTNGSIVKTEGTKRILRKRQKQNKVSEKEDKMKVHQHLLPGYIGDKDLDVILAEFNEDSKEPNVENNKQKSDKHNRRTREKRKNKANDSNTAKSNAKDGGSKQVVINTGKKDKITGIFVPLEEIRVVKNDDIVSVATENCVGDKAVKAKKCLSSHGNEKVKDNNALPIGASKNEKSSGNDRINSIVKLDTVSVVDFVSHKNKNGPFSGKNGPLPRQNSLDSKSLDKLESAVVCDDGTRDSSSNVDTPPIMGPSVVANKISSVNKGSVGKNKGNNENNVNTGVLKEKDNGTATMGLSASYNKGGQVSIKTGKNADKVEVNKCKGVTALGRKDNLNVISDVIHEDNDVNEETITDDGDCGVFADADACKNDSDSDFCTVVSKKNKRVAPKEGPPVSYERRARFTRPRYTRSITPPPQGNVLKSNLSHDLSPSVFPSLCNQELEAQGRCNSVGDVPTAAQYHGCHDDSDLESVKSLPISRCHADAVLPPSTVMSYARIAASPRVSSTKTSSRSTADSIPAVAKPPVIEPPARPAVWKGVAAERRHSIGSHPDSIDNDKEGVSALLKSGSQDLQSVETSPTERSIIVAQKLDEKLNYNVNVPTNVVPTLSASATSPSHAELEPIVDDKREKTIYENARTPNTYTRDQKRASGLLVKANKSVPPTDTVGRKSNYCVIFLDKRVPHPPPMDITFGFFDSDSFDESTSSPTVCHSTSSTDANGGGGCISFNDVKPSLCMNNASTSNRTSDDNAKKIPPLNGLVHDRKYAGDHSSNKYTDTSNVTTYVKSNNYDDLSVISLCDDHSEGKYRITNQKLSRLASSGFNELSDNDIDAVAPGDERSNPHLISPPPPTSGIDRDEFAPHTSNPRVMEHELDASDNAPCSPGDASRGSLTDAYEYVSIHYGSHAHADNCMPNSISFRRETLDHVSYNWEEVARFMKREWEKATSDSKNKSPIHIYSSETEN